MKIGIISDSHGSARYFTKALEAIGPADHYIHCGDVLPSDFFSKTTEDPDKLAATIRSMDNIIIVKGNGDLSEDEQSLGKDLHSPYLFTQLGPYRFFITHGHQFSRMTMIMKAKELGAQIICYGHSHTKELDFDGTIAIVNPGSVTLPRDGIHSCAWIENNKIIIVDVNTKEKLGIIHLDNL